MIPTLKALIIEPSYEIRLNLLEILKEKNFTVSVAENAKDGIQRVITTRFDLVICQYELDKHSGFRVFTALENHLISTGTAFFLLLKRYEIDDILIGMEMGIDGFIFTPFNKKTILGKIERHFVKRKQRGVFEAKRFNEFFASSPVAKFIIENLNIIKSNESFIKIVDSNDQVIKNSSILDLFNFQSNAKNKLNVRKLENGLIEYCCFEKVVYKNDLDLSFDIHLFSILNEKNGRMMAEVIPVGQETIYKMLHKNYPEQYVKRDEITRAIKNSSSVKLTNREVEIFIESAKGYPIKQIASNLNLSVRTVEKHRSNIMSKTNSHSIFEAVLTIQNKGCFHNELTV